MTQKKIEQQGFIIGIFMNVLMGSLGLFVYHITHIQALFIDAYFTIITLISGISAIVISKWSAKTSSRFPKGYFMLEPLYASIKSCTTLFLLTLSSIQVSQKAYQYFVYQKGEVLNLAPIIPYEIAMVVLCLSISLFYSRQNKRIGGASTMLLAESKSTKIDAIMCGGIGLAAFLVLLIKENSSLSFLLYTGDFFVTILLVLFSITTPFKVLKNAFIEICGGRLINEAIQKEFETCVCSHLGHKFKMDDCKIYKTGMSFRLDVEISGTEGIIDAVQLKEKKQQILTDLNQYYEFVHLNFIYA